MGQAAVKHDPIHLQLSDVMAKLKSPQLIGTICDALIADLKTLSDEARRRGSQSVANYFNADPSSDLPYVSEGGWGSTDRDAWYKGWYLGIGLNHKQKSSLGFLAVPVFAELRRRFSAVQRRQVFTESGAYYDTPDGIFEIYWLYLKIKL